MSEKKEVVEKTEKVDLGKLEKKVEWLMKVVNVIVRQFGLDVKDGFSKLAVMFFVALVSAAVLVFAAGEVDDKSSDTYGTYRLDSDGTEITLVVDKATIGTTAIGDVLSIGTNTVPVDSTGATGSVRAVTATVPIDNNSTITINDQTYRFRTSMTQANDIAIILTGAITDNTNSITFSNLLAAVNTGVSTGVPNQYFTGTAAAAGVTASSGGAGIVTVLSDAGYHGTLGNSLTFSAVGTNVLVAPTNRLAGGVDGTAGLKGSFRVVGTSLYFTHIDSVTNYADWTSK